VDRLLMPTRVFLGTGMEPGRMVNVNTAGETSLVEAVREALKGYNIADPAVVAANLLDYIDDDSQVTPVGGVNVTSQFYGFEQPCIYISELACRFALDVATGQIRRSYAVELYKPYFEDGSPGLDPAVGDWKLVIDDPATPGPDVEEPIQWSGTTRFHVLLAEASHPQASLATNYVKFSDPNDGNVNPAAAPQSLSPVGFKEGHRVELQRQAGDGRWLTVDRKVVPAGWMRESQPDGVARSLQRDIRVDKCIFRLWASPAEAVGTVPSLGSASGHYLSSDPRKLQAHPANRPLNNIGELAQILAVSIYGLSDTALSVYQPEELLIDAAHPGYANLFNYLTVINPLAHNPDLRPSEMRVKGRININTAPPFVLAQLPWMQYRYDQVMMEVLDTYERAVQIVEHRNANGAFRSIAGLMQVPAMRELGSDGINNLFNVTGTTARGPDLTDDDVVDDLEERDLIFTRISDLVTVRSDAFTAYILVRIGTDGPQKRVVAILDRSQVMSQGDPVRIVGLQQVPDPR
jgi:hypothetical protein